MHLVKLKLPILSILILLIFSCNYSSQQVNKEIIIERPDNFLLTYAKFSCDLIAMVGYKKHHSGMLNLDLIIINRRDNSLRYIYSEDKLIFNKPIQSLSQNQYGIADFFIHNKKVFLLRRDGSIVAISDGSSDFVGSVPLKDEKIAKFCGSFNFPNSYIITKKTYNDKDITSINLNQYNLLTEKIKRINVMDTFNLLRKKIPEQNLIEIISKESKLYFWMLSEGLFEVDNSFEKLHKKLRLVDHVASIDLKSDLWDARDNNIGWDIYEKELLTPDLLKFDDNNYMFAMKTFTKDPLLITLELMDGKLVTWDTLYHFKATQIFSDNNSGLLYAKQSPDSIYFKIIDEQELFSEKNLDFRQDVNDQLEEIGGFTIIGY